MGIFRLLYPVILTVANGQLAVGGIGGLGGGLGGFGSSFQSERDTTTEQQQNNNHGLGGVFTPIHSKPRRPPPKRTEIRIQTSESPKEIDDDVEQQKSPGFGGLGTSFGEEPLEKEIQVKEAPLSMGSVGNNILVNHRELESTIINPCHDESNGNCEHYCREATNVEISLAKSEPNTPTDLMFLSEEMAILCYCAKGFTLRTDHQTCSNDEEQRLKKRLDELTITTRNDTWVVPVVIVCLIGALTILLMGGITYFCVRKTDKQRQVLEHSISTQQSIVGLGSGTGSSGKITIQ